MNTVYFGEAVAPQNSQPPETILPQTPPPSPQQKHFNWPLHKWFLLVIAVMVLALLGGYIAYRPQFLGQTSYSCPKTEYVDCMPVVAPDGKKVERPQCGPEYLAWAKENCPGFQGAAY